MEEGDAIPFLVRNPVSRHESACATLHWRLAHAMEPIKLLFVISFIPNPDTSSSPRSSFLWRVKPLQCCIRAFGPVVVPAFLNSRKEILIVPYLTDRCSAVVLLLREPKILNLLCLHITLKHLTQVVRHQFSFSWCSGDRTEKTSTRRFVVVYRSKQETQNTQL